MGGGGYFFWLGASADADPALVASDQAASRLAPTGFDPLRLCEIVQRLRDADSALCWGDTVRGLSLVRDAGALAAGIKPATEPCTKVTNWTHG